MKILSTPTELNALQPMFIGELCLLNGTLHVSEGLVPGAWSPVNQISKLPPSGPGIIGDELIQVAQDSRAGGLSLGQLRQWIGGQFSLRRQSTGDAADHAGSRIILETVGATRANPYLVQFDQIIIELFTGPGEFYLDERDASDFVGGESTITVGTKDGLSAGYTPGSNHVIMVDKIYTVTFNPGTTGDGIYVINVSSLHHKELPIGILPPAPAIYPLLT